MATAALPAAQPVLAAVPLVDFGNVTVGSTSVVTIQLSNAGMWPVEINHLPAPDPAGPFRLVGTTCGGGPPILLPGLGSNCEVEYAFEPNALGPVSEDIPVIHTSGISLGDITLEGNGV